MSDINTTKHLVNGERIYLREVTLDDVSDDYYQWLNDEEVTQYLETKYYEQNIDSIRKYVKAMVESEHDIFFAVIVKENEQHIGNIKLGPINPFHKFADVSLVLGDRGSWGKGYATEAVKLVVDYAFHKLGLHRLEAGIYENNTGSQKVFEKAGFKHEGTKEQCRNFNGEWVNEKCYGIVNRKYA